MPSTNLEGQVPVFVSPSSLTFSVQDESSQRQVLTIYNPYDFPINYMLLSNAQEKFYVPDSYGTLKPRNRVDVLVRYNFPIQKYVGAKFKLRVQITEKGRTKVLGKKDIDTILVQSVGDLQQDTDTFEELPLRRRRPSFNIPTQQAFAQSMNIGNQNTESWLCLQVVAILLCLAALMMPTEGDKLPTIIPPVLHLSTSFKNVASFILGIVVCTLLNRST